MAATFHFELEKFLQCPICLEDCRDPRVLPCLHSLCQDCLQRHITTSAENNKFNCPECRHSCQLPAGGAASLPKNFMLNGLRELLRKAQDEAAEDQERICANNNRGNTGIRHTAATVFCTDCAEFYCSSCESFHKMFDATREHRLRPAGEIGVMDVLAAESKKKRPKCDQHPSQSVDIYCDTCQVPVCSTCCHLTHQEHRRRDLAVVAAESKTNLQYSIRRTDRIEVCLNEHLNKLNTSEENICKDANEVCREISREAEKLRAAITKREQSLIQKVRSSRQAVVSDVKAAVKETELNKVAAQSFKSYIQTLETSGDVIDQVTHSLGIQEQLRQLEMVPLQLVQWNVSLNKESQGVAMLGTVSIDKTLVPSGVVGGKMKAVLGDPIACLKPGPSLGFPLSGLAVSGHFVFVTGWWQPYLWIHNMQTNTHKQHNIKSMKPAGMAVVGLHNNSNTVAITDIGKALHFVTISPQNMDITNYTVKKIPFEPRNVSVDSKTGKLIIANQTDKEIVVCDSTGNIEDRVAVKTKIGSMRCAFTIDDGYVILDHSDPGRIHWVTRHGDVSHTYGERNGELLCKPEGMVVDKQGLLIPADSLSNRVHLIDRNRQLSHYILTEKDDFKFPVCVCLDETRPTGRLFVAHVDRHNAATVSVYTWPFSLGDEHETLVKRYN